MSPSRRSSTNYRPRRDRRELTIAVATGLAILVFTAIMIWVLGPHDGGGGGGGSSTTTTAPASATTAAPDTTPTTAPASPTTGAPATTAPAGGG